MKIDIGSEVWSDEGVVVGRVNRVVLNPKTFEVSHLVVADSDTLGRDSFVIPLSLVERSGRSRVQLRAGLRELEHLPEFFETEYVIPDPSRLAPADYLIGQIVLQAKRARDAELGPLTLGAGMAVECLDGPLGTLDEVLLDPLTDRLHLLVVRSPHVSHRDVVNVPAEYIQGVSAERIRLKVTREQLDLAPLPPSGPYLPTEGLA